MCYCHFLVLSFCVTFGSVIAGVYCDRICNMSRIGLARDHRHQLKRPGVVPQRGSEKMDGQRGENLRSGLRKWDQTWRYKPLLTYWFITMHVISVGFVDVLWKSQFYLRTCSKKVRDPIWIVEMEEGTSNEYQAFLGPIHRFKKSGYGQTNRWTNGLND